MPLPTIQQNIDLRTFNTFGISVKAQHFTVVGKIEELSALLQDSTWKNIPKFILGGGSNILFTNDYSGLVIKNEIMGIEHLTEDDHHVWLKVGAGVNWHQLVMYCIDQGLAGLENLSLIPGTVGAAPMQNIGAYGVELKNVFQQLEAIRIKDGKLVIFDHHQCEFDYRDSIFKTKYKGEFFIVNVTLRLSKKSQFNITYGAIQDTLKEMKVDHLTLKAVSDAVIHIRRSKLPDPQVIGNAGSFFKNAIIPVEKFNELQKRFSEIPHFKTPMPDKIKISSGWLIEQCGWKGKRDGHVGVYDKQALVIVNYGSATGADVQLFVKQIQDSVRERFGIVLVPEVNII
ncbi:MAG: UDP-N-acetylmuramate dehydrogenase [Gammaproteobacteria bacterium]